MVVQERKRQPTPAGGELEKKDEEEWPLKDVVFIEDVKTVPIGKVLKVCFVVTVWLLFL
jgi:E3 ubiquitin-protein ligase EDD1